MSRKAGKEKIMTMTNAEWMLKNGYKFRELDWICDNAGDYGYVILLKNECIGKVKDCYSTKAITTWLDMEHKEPILSVFLSLKKAQCMQV